MSLKNFNGKTFVAFIDISGFKNMMQKQKAGEALQKFYSIGYKTLSEYSYISGVFISDCGILYHNSPNDQAQEKFTQMLNVIAAMNKQMLEANYLLTTSVAYGDFEYKDKIELPNMTKNSFHGNAYLDAYMDNEHGTPKIKAGECRVLISDDIKELNTSSQNIKKTKTHYNYYWMLQENQTIEQYEQNVRKIENKYSQKTKKLNDEKFEDLKQLLRGDTQ